MRNSKLKKKLYKDNLLKEICYICGLKPIYNNKPLTLELDHIDGNHNNNDITNLRILCPNCHSQTDTFGGKNIKKYKNKIEQELKSIKNINKFFFLKLLEVKTIKEICLEYNISRKTFKEKVGNFNLKKISKVNSRKTIRPTKEVLEKLLLTNSYVAVGKQFKVSDNTIRNWVKYYEKENY